MPISRLRHEETTPNGEPLYVVEVDNKEFDGYRLKVEFKKGQGLTKSEAKAQRFSEEFGYTIHLHKSHTPWKEVKEAVREYISYDEDDKEIIFTEENLLDEDGEEIEAYS